MLCVCRAGKQNDCSLLYRLRESLLFIHLSFIVSSSYFILLFYFILFYYPDFIILSSFIVLF